MLHGGPGSGCQPGIVAPLDLSRHWGIAPDQRGCGASRPHGRTARNHTAVLVSDLEDLRRHLGLERWSILAGSWGATLALAYAHRHPQRVERLVLRGAFAVTRREVGRLLCTLWTRGETLTPRRHPWPRLPWTSLPALLAGLRKVLQTGTPGVASVRVARRWALLETQAAERGMRRALRLSAGSAQPAPALRPAWAGLHRSIRRQRAVFDRPAGRADRRLLGKFRVQAHYLARRGFLRSGALDQAVRCLALEGVPVDWVHGRCDAVCPPANSRAWAAMAQRLAPGSARLRQPLAGHLGHEPGMFAALEAAVRDASPQGLGADGNEVRANRPTTKDAV